MIGAFVQVNLDSPRAVSHPLGYVITERGCWDWVGARQKGYGSWGGQLADRILYRQMRGTIPEGHDLDHLCRNILCVNPWHIEPVSHAENLRRGVGFIGQNVAKVACPQGHPYDPTNAHGGRRCRECGRERQRLYNQQRRAADPSYR